MFVRLSDGALRNGYTLRILNKRLEPQEFALTVDRPADADIDIVGDAARADGRSA